MLTLSILRRLACGALALGCALGGAACDDHNGPGPVSPGPADHCAPDDLAGCERMVVRSADADLPAALARLDEAAGGSAWRDFYAALGRTPDALFVVHAPDDAPAAAEAAAASHGETLAMPSAHVDARALVAVLGRGAGRAHVLFASARGLEHVMCRDVLAPFALGLVPALAAARDPAVRAQELELWREMDTAAGAAGQFDYLAAAHHAETVQKLLAALPADDRVWLRGRYFLNLLASSGMELEPPEGAPKARTDAPDASAGSSYEKLLAILVAPATKTTTSATGAVTTTAKTAPELFAAWRAAFAETPELTPDRLAELAYLYAPEGTCPPPVVPPMEATGDLLFAYRLSRSLDPAPPAAKGASGHADANPASAPSVLPLDAWLVRYDTMVRLIETSRTTWAMAASLVAERGELYGLRADGTDTYARVSELMHKHVGALRALATAEPTRFKPFSVLALLYQRGLLTDRRLRQEVIDFASSSIALKLQATDRVSQIWEAAGAAFVAGLSLPGDAQAAQFLALAAAVADKLGTGKLEPAHGWALAGLHAAHGALRLMLGEPERARTALDGAVSALDANDIEYRGLARLAMAAAHYVSLIGTGALDPGVSNPELFAPGRKKALAALRQALGELAERGPATPEERDVQNDTAELMDGAIAAIATAIGSDSGAPGVSCAADAHGPGDPKVREAFARLRKTRKRLVERPAFKAGDASDQGGPWIKRVRLVATVLSDAIDIAGKESESVRFAVGDAAAVRIVEAALADWHERDLAGAIAGAYGLARAALGAEELDVGLLKRNASHVLGGLAAAFGGNDGGGAGSLFSALASATNKLEVASDASKSTEKLPLLLVRSARNAYQGTASAQGDVLLLGAVAAAAARKEALPPEAAALAREFERPVLIAVLAYSERFSDDFDPAGLVAVMQGLTRGQCTAPSPDAVGSVLAAFHSYHLGDTQAARRALEAFLARAEAQGLDVPRLNFAYQEMTNGKVFSLQVGQSYARDLIRSSGTFQVGLGMQSVTTQTSGMSTNFADASAQPSIEEAARYYAHVAVITAVLHWLDGDNGAAQRAARRAIAVYRDGVRLGTRRVDSKASTTLWNADAAATLGLAAELAAEHGEIFLAGDLWSLVTFDEDVDDAGLEAFFAELPQPLRGLRALEPVRERAMRPLRELASRSEGTGFVYPCVKKRTDPKPWLAVGCSDYPTAIGLRIASALPALPRLTTGAESGRAECAPLRALDRFFAQRDQGQYDPDTFVAAVQGLRLGGRVGDAAALLARQRDPNHCGALVAEARALAERGELGMALRADLVTIAVNCANPETDPRIEADVLVLDELTKALATQDRNLGVVLFAARQAVAGRPALLAALAKQPDFVSRWIGQNPELATAALLLHHAGYTLADKSFDALETLPYYRLLCTTYPPAERGPLCSTIGLMRSGGSADDRKRAARAALGELLGGGSAPPAPPP